MGRLGFTFPHEAVDNRPVSQSGGTRLIRADSNLVVALTASNRQAAIGRN